MTGVDNAFLAVRIACVHFLKLDKIDTEMQQAAQTMQEIDEDDEEFEKIKKAYNEQQNRKFTLITVGVLAMAIAAFCMFYHYISHYYDDHPFTSVVTQLNQLSKDAEDASGS